MAVPKLLYFEQEFTTNNLGNIELVPPTKNNCIDYSKMHMELTQDSHISTVKKLTVEVMMGKLSGTTLGQRIDSWALDGPPKIRSYPVIAPEMSVFIVNGPKNTKIGILGWILLQ